MRNAARFWRGRGRRIDTVVLGLIAMHELLDEARKPEGEAFKELREYTERLTQIVAVLSGREKPDAAPVVDSARMAHPGGPVDGADDSGAPDSTEVRP